MLAISLHVAHTSYLQREHRKTLITPYDVTQSTVHGDNSGAVNFSATFELRL